MEKFAFKFYPLQYLYFMANTFSLFFSLWFYFLFLLFEQMSLPYFHDASKFQTFTLLGQDKLFLFHIESDWIYQNSFVLFLHLNHKLIVFNMGIFLET